MKKRTIKYYKSQGLKPSIVNGKLVLKPFRKLKDENKRYVPAMKKDADINILRAMSGSGITGHREKAINISKSPSNLRLRSLIRGNATKERKFNNRVWTKARNWIKSMTSGIIRSKIEKRKKIINLKEQ
jgi:hypothetical protein